jgi:hypothetical protein
MDELYSLDDRLRRVGVVDLYESLIWTERYASAGDFELVVVSSPENRAALPLGTLFTQRDSNRVMRIDSVEDSDDSDGRAMLTIKGPSLEDLTDDRAARNTLASLNAAPKWSFNDTPTNIARAIFQAICVDGVVSSADIIPFITPGSLYPADGIAESTTAIKYDVDIKKSVYAVLRDLADSYGFGFRISRNGENSQLFFNIYTGTDRTSRQTLYPAIVFSPGLENFTGTKYLTDLSSFKNVAYVIAPAGSLMVPGVGYENVTGFDRHVLTVDASDVTLSAGDALNAELTKRGLAELAKSQSLQGLDGEVSQYSQYVYGTDYNLGDIVESRNKDGVTEYLKVTEQIFVSDSNGQRSYPTLTSELFVTPGSWFSSIGNHAWIDAQGTWAQPL